MAGLIVYVLFGLIPIYQAFQVRRNPMKIRNLRKMKALQPDVELDPRLQQLYFVNYLITGILWMLTGLIGWLFGMKLTYVMFALTIIGGIAVLIARWRYTGVVQAWQLVVLALGIVLMVVYSLWAFRNSKVEVLPAMISIEGDYGQTIYYQAMDSVFVTDELPEIKYCKEGYSVLGNKKGEFQLKDGNDAKFYLLGKEAPYLKLYTHNGLILVNRKTAEETKMLIDELSGKIKVIVN